MLPAAGSGPAAPGAASMSVENEKVIVEVMNAMYKEGNYGKILDVANKLLARNPNSQGAKIALQKAMDKEKLQNLFDSLGTLFK